MTHDVGDEERHLSRADRNVVKEIAAELGAGHVSGRDGEAIDDHFGGGQKALLERPRLAELPFEPMDVPTVLLPAPAQFEAPLDQRLQHFPVERLLDEVERPAANRANQLLIEIVEAARHQDDVDVGLVRLQPDHQLEAVQSGHSDVEDDEVRIELGGERHGVCRGLTPHHAVHAAQHALDGTDHAGLVIDHQDARWSFHCIVGGSVAGTRDIAPASLEDAQGTVT